MANVLGRRDSTLLWVAASGVLVGVFAATILPVRQGGTGVATLTDHGVVVGQGTNAVHITSAGTAGQLLTSGGASADPAFGGSAIIQPATGADTVALKLGPIVGSPTADLFDVYSDSALSNLVFSINSTGNITFVGNALKLQEGSAPTGAGSYDLLWADSTAHALKVNNNNGGALYLVGTTAAGSTNGDLIVHNGTSWTRFAGNTSGSKVFQEDASGNASWATGGSGYTTIQNNGTPLTQRATFNIDTTSGLQAADDAGNTRTNISFSNQDANKVLAGPTTGSAAAPTFRALVSQDFPALTVFVMGDTGGANVNPAGANQIRLFGLVIPYPLTCSHLITYETTADGTGLYDVGIYNTSGSLVANTGAHHLGAGVIDDIAITQGSIRINPGKYFFAFTGDAVTGAIRFAGNSGGSKFTFFFSLNAGTSASGVLPGSITAPVDSWTQNSEPYFALY